MRRESSMRTEIEVQKVRLRSPLRLAVLQADVVPENGGLGREVPELANETLMKREASKWALQTVP